MTYSTIQLMGTSETNLNLTGDKVRTDNYFGFGDGFMTVSISIDNLQGRVYIEGTMQLEPTDNDWFAINMTETTKYIQYPLDPAKPTGNLYGDSGVNIFNIKINCLYIRARLDRSYLDIDGSDTELVAQYGNIKKIVLAR